MPGEQGDVQVGELTPSDEELVDRVRAGRMDAFDALIVRYQRRATSVAYRLVGNLHDALEVTQEALLRAYRNLDSLEDGRKFGSWLLRIVTNLSLNFRRDRAVGGPRLSLDDCIVGEDESVVDRFEDSAADLEPDAGLRTEELSVAVREALAELPEQQRLALVLFSLEQLPQKEVAEILSCSVEVVKWSVFQARKKMRERLADHLG